MSDFDDDGMDLPDDDFGDGPDLSDLEAEDEMLDLDFDLAGDEPEGRPSGGARVYATAGPARAAAPRKAAAKPVSDPPAPSARKAAPAKKSATKKAGAVRKTARPAAKAKAKAAAKKAPTRKKAARKAPARPAKAAKKAVRPARGKASAARKSASKKKR